MKRIKDILLILAFTLFATAFSLPAMAKTDDPTLDFPHLDLQRICGPYWAPPGKPQGQIPPPFNLICWKR